MSATHKLTLTFSDGGPSGINSTQNIAGDVVANVPDLPIAGSATTEVDVSFKYTLLQDYILYSTVDCTVKTNSSGSPDDTIALVAGIAKAFPFGANLFAHDVTKFYIVVAGAVAGVFNFRSASNAHA